ncbi:MAG: transcriptional repressor [Thermodesulfobacteriota bacterium]
MKRGFTNLRKEILKYIEQSEQPLTAKEIYQMLQSKPNLSTVYRALDYLCKNKYVKTISFSSEGNYFYSAKMEHSHFIYCKECTEIKTFDDCFAEKIQDNVEDKFDYKITDHIFYFSGICNTCLEN